MKIGIVNDLSMAAEALRRAIALKPEHQTVWIARDGVEAVAMCARETPDLILMDLIMPRMDGVEATRRIMSHTPCAILVVTASVGANADRVFEAMGHGALDAVDTPLLGAGLQPVNAAALLAKIDSIARMIGSRTGVTGTFRSGIADVTVPRNHEILAIGASAGGPAALSILLAGLPADFPAAVVIVQHVDAQFAIGMAAWLSQHSKMPVRVAREADAPTPGTVLLAGSNDHLTMKTAERLGYTSEPADYVYRPSVDVFFHSVCRLWSGRAVGVLLTGMGRDGAIGLKAMRDRGYHTIAQDQASCAVYGMPKAAAALNAAVEILPLSQIATQLTGIFGSGLQSGRPYGDARVGR